MNLVTDLLKENSKRNIVAIAQYILKDESKFSELITLLSSENTKIVQRASWVLSSVIDNNTQYLIEPYWDKLLKLISKQKHPAYKRNLLHIIRMLDTIPEKIQSDVLELCINTATNHQETAANRAFSIHILGKLCVIHPELINETIGIIEPLIEHNLPSIRYSAKHTIKKITKNKKIFT